MTTATALAVALPTDPEASESSLPVRATTAGGATGAGPHGRRFRKGAGRGGLWRPGLRRLATGGPLPRAAWAAAAALVGTLLAQIGSSAPGTLRPTAAAAFAVGAAFGPAGILAFALVEAAVLLAIGGPLAVALLVALCDGLLGAVAYLAFRDVGRVGRGLPNLASYLTLLAAALLGSLATGLFLAWIGFADR
ncbi:MAG TPA: hypothetical protein VM617_07045, partial [Thermoanaerobaculia bacterium]|nr:hypothetical protein [Thermoanaerobaculia bacterium]